MKVCLMRAALLFLATCTPLLAAAPPLPAEHLTVTTLDTAGCVLVIPSGPDRVSTICESGHIVTITLDAQGHEAA